MSLLVKTMLFGVALSTFGIAMLLPPHFTAETPGIVWRLVLAGPLAVLGTFLLVLVETRRMVV